MISRADAAAARAEQHRSRRTPPPLRHSTRPPLRSAPVPAPMLSSESGDSVLVWGYASITEHEYEMWDAFGPYVEIVRNGAFSETLQRPDLDVSLVLSHDQLRRLARTTTGTLALWEDARGLGMAAALLTDDHDVQYILPKIRSGLVSEMSFSFLITDSEWSEDFSTFYIKKVDLHRGDVSIVGYGANPATTVGLRRRGRDIISATDIQPRARRPRAWSMITDQERR